MREQRRRQGDFFLGKWGAFRFLVLFAFLLGAQLSYDYWRERRVYEAQQQKDFLALEQRFLKVTKDLDHLLEITSQRIAKHLHSERQIQNILSSLQGLSFHTRLPPLQRGLFQAAPHYPSPGPGPGPVTRFGVRPDQNPKILRPGFFVTDQGKRLFKTQGVQDQGRFLGWLEVEMDVQEFMDSLRPPSSLKINLPSLPEPLSLEDFLLWVTPKPFKGLLGILSERAFFYLQFFIYALVFDLLWRASHSSTKRGAVKKYKGHIQEGEQKLKGAYEKIVSLEKGRKALQEELQHQNTSLTTSQELMKTTLSLVKQEAKTLYRTLMKEMFKAQEGSEEPLGLFLEKDSPSPLQGLQNLSEGIPFLKSREEGAFFFLWEAIHHVMNLFAYRIYKSRMTVEVDVSEDLKVPLNPYVALFLLINVIGKAVYAVPGQGRGRVFLRAFQEKGEVGIEVEHNGFDLGSGPESLVLKSLPWFVGDEVLQKLCGDNSVRWDLQKSPQGAMGGMTQGTMKGTTQVRLTFVNPPVEEAYKNVVPLFR